MLATEVAIMSDKGGRTYNEDACGHWQSEHQLCCVLADGAGGHGGGDVAARLAVKELLSAFAATPSTDGAQLSNLVRAANQAILDSRAPGPTRDMHTTVVCLVIDTIEHAAHWAHAGDSRLYWFRDGSIARRTRDHSLVQSLVEAGMWKESELSQHPQRSELVSALGVASADLAVSASTETTDVEAGDVFFLCTDGCWEHLDDTALVQSLLIAETPVDWLNDIATRITAATDGRASHDNFSALAVWVSAAPSELLSLD